MRFMLRAWGDRLACWTAIAVGGALVSIGYLHTKATMSPVEALAQLASGGVGGLVCLAVGAGGLVCTGMYDEWRKLDRIDLATQHRPLPDPLDLSDSPAPAGALTTRRNVGPGTLALRLDWAGDGLRRGATTTALGVTVAVTFVVAGWRVAAGTLSLAQAARGLSIGVVGLVLAVLAMTGHAIWLRSRLVRRKADLLGRYLPAAAPVGVARHQGTRVFVVSTSQRFHRSGCPLLQADDAVAIERDDVGDRKPCGICRSGEGVSRP